MGYKRLDAEDFLVSADSVSQTVWTDRVATLSTFFTSSTQEQASVSGDYYLAVYQTASTSISAEPQFDISYGNSAGLGGVLYNANISGKSPTGTVYGQFRTLVLEDENSSFTFGTQNPTVSNSIYVISLERSRYKEKLLPGSLSLKLQSGANALTLADGTTSGQIKIINMIVDGGDGTLTPTTFANGSTITFDAVGESATLVWNSTVGWVAISTVGATIA